MKKGVFCDCRLDKKCRASLERLGYTVLPLYPSDNLAPPVASHPDMICHRLAENRWIFEKSAYEKNKNMLDSLGLDIIISKTSLGKDYPDDIAFNAARVGDVLICKSDRLTPEIRDYALPSGLRIIDTKQGYAKCSVCITGERGIITSDTSIQRAAQSAGIDCLLIMPGYIRLDCYSTGFIGGCSGMLDCETLVFTGIIDLHPDYLRLKDFTKARGIDIICLSDETLYDYGSLFVL